MASGVQTLTSASLLEALKFLYGTALFNSSIETKKKQWEDVYHADNDPIYRTKHK